MKYLANVVTLEYFPEKCTGCRRCIEVCPRQVFEIRDKKAFILDRDCCIECGACANNCEYEALRVNAGVGCATAIILGMLAGTEPDCTC
jgi:NAD-dependent dihydropyrimidine dehydrogenase PreA subunit